MNFIIRLLAPFLVPIALIFAVPVDDNVNPYGQKIVKRSKLPKWASWLDTPDQTLPGGLYEPAILDIYEGHGDFITSWVWLGFRNTGFGYAWKSGKPATNYFALLTEQQRIEQGLWQKERKIGFLKLLTGWSVYRDWYSVSTNDGFWAIPRFSIRLASQD